ncbi:MAG: cytochrome c3 family protein [Planctomycetota bacterium]
MRLRSPALWLGAISAVLVIGFVWTDRDRISPGSVSPVHARDAELAGTGCERCHGSESETMADACADCHRDVTDGIAQDQGFHAHMESDADACGTCHIEHHGAELPLVSARSFSLAGFEERDTYDHRGLAYSLSGRHRELACKDCHRNADIELLPQGEKRFLGLAQGCTACHEDVHGGKLADCASCHGQEHPFAQVAEFVHPPAFRLEGAHAGHTCWTCHPKGSEFAIENPVPRPRACMDCHASPHGDAFRAAAGTSCEDCHPAVRGGFTPEQSRLTPAQHAWTGFPLDAPHDRASCESCHPRDAASFANAHPGRDASDCRACHADPHLGQFDRGAFAGGGCLVCHDRLAFEPPAFGLELHARTGFALTGSHAAVPCASCHAVREPATRFDQAPTKCEGCHADAHDGFFDRRAQGCAECHGTASFSAIPADFHHGDATGFELEGAHARAECAECHAPSPRPDERGRTFGFAHAPLPGQSCSVCHADPHAGAFDDPGDPRELDGREDCARCHTVDAFHPTRARFDHAAWTGFELAGAHAELGCEQCHAPSATPGRFTQARGTECSSCHADPHVGQFALAGATDCARCHAASGPFRNAVFDHQRDSRFRLDEGHRDLACSACHKPFPAGNGTSAIRYKPLGTSCGDCHDARGRSPR